MSELAAAPVFGVLLSLAAYEIGVYINKKTKLSLCNPLLIAVALLIVLLNGLQIEYEDFNVGGRLISFFLYPATVALALPVYKKFSLFKKHALPVMVSILCSAIFGIACIIALSKVFRLPDELIKSLVPKSITTPIGMELSQQLGGIPSIAVAAIILTGIFGSIIGPLLYKILKINDKVALGIAMGASSHAMGTARAMELGETEGAMSGLTMALSGVITVFLAPVIWKLFLIFFP